MGREVRLSRRKVPEKKLQQSSIPGVNEGAGPGWKESIITDSSSVVPPFQFRGPIAKELLPRML